MLLQLVLIQKRGDNSAQRIKQIPHKKNYVLTFLFRINVLVTLDNPLQTVFIWRSEMCTYRHDFWHLKHIQHIQSSVSIFTVCVHCRENNVALSSGWQIRLKSVTILITHRFFQYQYAWWYCKYICTITLLAHK